MQADARAFEQGVAILVGRFDSSLQELEPEAAIAQLNQRLAEAKENQKLLFQERRHQRDAEAKLHQAGQDLARAITDLELLYREAGAADAESARQAWSYSNQKREFQRVLAECDTRLGMVSAGKPIAEFLVDAASVGADSIAGRLEQIRRDTLSMKQEREAIESKRRALDAEALAMQGSDQAPSAIQRISGISGRLSSEVEQYVRLKTASFVLHKAVERYRSRNQGPVLDSASRLFAEFTRNAFSSLRVETEDGVTVLVGVRAAGTIVPIEGMSDGTRDQLFLALRIASLEHYFAAHEPTPFIVDDVLLNFDDERAAAALTALDALSAKTQVIFFTHHQRLVDLAGTNTGAAVCSMRAEASVK
jgi:uncharacterized protein YhaN